VTLNAGNPTVNDDEDSHGVGDMWVNTTAKSVFILLDATNGAAVWQLFGGGLALAQGKKVFLNELDGPDFITSDGTDTIFRTDGDFVFGAGTEKYPVFASARKNSTGDPAGRDGMLYFNSVDNVLKFYAEGGWRTIATW
jgi:hypothetical protein